MSLNLYRQGSQSQDHSSLLLSWVKMSFYNGLFWRIYVVVLKDGLPWYLLLEIVLVSTD